MTWQAQRLLYCHINNCTVSKHWEQAGPWNQILQKQVKVQGDQRHLQIATAAHKKSSYKEYSMFCSRIGLSERWGGPISLFSDHFQLYKPQYTDSTNLWLALVKRTSVTVIPNINLGAAAFSQINTCYLTCNNSTYRLFIVQCHLYSPVTYFHIKLVVLLCVTWFAGL